MVLFFSESLTMCAQILSLVNLNLPNHFGCLTIFTSAILNTFFCAPHLAAISAVKYMFSFSFKLTEDAVKLVSPLTSSLSLSAVFRLDNWLFFCWLSLVTVLMFSRWIVAFSFSTLDERECLCSWPMSLSWKVLCELLQLSSSSLTSGMLDVLCRLAHVLTSGSVSSLSVMLDVLCRLAHALTFLGKLFFVNSCLFWFCWNLFFVSTLFMFSCFSDLSFSSSATRVADLRVNPLISNKIDDIYFNKN